MRPMNRLFVFFVSLMLSVGSVQAASLDKQQQQEVRELVRKTLVENPEILVEAMTELKKKEEAVQKNAEVHILAARQKELFEDSDSPVMGNLKAKLTITMFSDYNCGYCKRQDPILKEIVKQNPDVKVVIKELPILGPESQEAAKYALAAYYHDKTKYNAVNERLMSKPGRHSTASIKAALKVEGIDADKLKISDRVEKQISENLRLAADLGIRGTPALVFPDQIIRGYTQEGPLKKMIEDRLKKMK